MSDLQTLVNTTVSAGQILRTEVSLNGARVEIWSAPANADKEQYLIVKMSSNTLNKAASKLINMLKQMAKGNG